MRASPQISLWGFAYMIIQQAVDEYLVWKGLNRPDAMKSYRPFLKPFNKFFFKKELEKLTMFDISNFISISKEHYKPKSVYYIVSILKDLFKYYPNIINPHRIQSPRLVMTEIKYLSEEDFILIDESLSEWNIYELRAKLIHNILWSTGIRVGELCSIGLDDINLEKRCAKIITEKSKKVGYIMWNKPTHELLLRYLGTRLCRPGDLLFDIKPRQVERIIKEVSLNVGVDGITPHKYRHGKAHKVIADGGSIDDVSFILRHSNPELTKKFYLRLDQRENLSIMGKYV